MIIFIQQGDEGTVGLKERPRAEERKNYLGSRSDPFGTRELSYLKCNLRDRRLYFLLFPRTDLEAVKWKLRREGRLHFRSQL